MTAKTKDKNDNSIFIGGKHFMNYVNGVIVQFNINNVSEVIIKSRGKFISKAVDVAEVTRRKFLIDKNLKVKNIVMGSKEFENDEGKLINVSTLEIVLSK